MNKKEKNQVISIIIIVVLALIFIFASLSLKRLETKEIGIRYDNLAKILGTETEYEGLHNGPLGFYFIIFPSVFETMSFDQISCLNKDGVITVLKISYQFKADPSKLLGLVQQFKDFDGYKKVLRSSGKAAIYDSCALFTTEMFQTQRGQFQEHLRETMRDYCNSLYCELNDLQVINVGRPREYETAVRAKEAAKVNIKVALNERPRELLKAETFFEKAKKEAEKLMNDAETQAKITNTKATNEAKTLEFRYAKDLEIYQNIKSKQGLTNEGLISYIGIQGIAYSKNDINLAISSPALTGYKSIKEEL